MTGREFAALRRKVGLTQVVLAPRLGCTSTHISRMENSATVPKVFELALRAIAYGVGELDRDAA